MMNDRDDGRQLPPNAGLCVRCVHARAVPSATGQIFVRCARSATDPAFPKYPRLPVVVCAGYDPAPAIS
jgi:hypothetical protein